MQSDKLKACPFCGSKKATDEYDDGLHWVKCAKCGATGPANTKYSDEDDADWNTRADTRPVPAPKLDEDALRVDRATIKGALVKADAALEAWQQEVPDGRFRPSHWKVYVELTKEGRKAIAEAEAALASPKAAPKTEGELADTVGEYLGWLDADGHGVDDHIREAEAALRRAYYAALAKGQPAEKEKL